MERVGEEGREGRRVEEERESEQEQEREREREREIERARARDRERHNSSNLVPNNPSVSVIIAVTCELVHAVCLGDELKLDNSIHSTRRWVCTVC